MTTATQVKPTKKPRPSPGEAPPDSLDATAEDDATTLELLGEAAELMKDPDKILGKHVEDAKISLEEVKDVAGETDEQKEVRDSEIAGKLLAILDTRVDSTTEKRRLRREVEKASKTGKFKSVVDHLKKVKGIRGNKEVEKEIDEVVGMQDPFMRSAKQIEQMKEVLAGAADKFGGLGGGEGGAEVVETIRAFYKKNKQGRWVPKNPWEIAKADYEKAEGFFGKGKGFVVGLVKGFFLYKQLKKFESSVNMGMEMYETGDSVVEKYGGMVREGIDRAEAGIEKGKEYYGYTQDQLANLRESPESAAAIAALNKKLGQQYDNVAKAVVEKKDPTKAVQGLSKGMKSALSDIEKASPQTKMHLAKAAQQGKVPGLGLKTSGRFMVISVLTQAMHKAISDRDPNQLGDTIGNSSIWKEAIPGVGSYKSIGRLFKDNGDPMWAKGLDVGINLVGDVWLIGATVAGCIFGVGLGCAPGAAAGAAGKVGMVTAARSALKLGTGAAVKGATKAAIGSVTKKMVYRKIIREGGKKMVQETIKETGKKPVIKVVEYTGQHVVKKEVLHQGVVRASLKTSMKLAGGLILVEEAIKKVFPVDKVKEMAVNVGINKLEQNLTPGMKQLYGVMTGGKDMVEGVKDQLA